MCQQALDESDRIVLDSTFGSISGIAQKYGLDAHSRTFDNIPVKQVGSAMIREICEQEDEEQGLALQRNREAREVRMFRDEIQMRALAMHS